MSEKKKRLPRVRVLFVCTGNTCRSPMAEFIFKDFLRQKKLSARFVVMSAGIAADGSPMADNAAATLKLLGIRFIQRQSVQLTLKMAESADLIVCMTGAHKRAIGTSPKLVTIAELTGGNEVADPYGGDLAAYKLCADHLKYACQEILDEAVKRFSDRFPPVET